jgi:hypothetical protein
MRNIFIGVAGVLFSSYLFCAPSVMAQYNMVPMQQQSSLTPGQTMPAAPAAPAPNPGPPSHLISAPQIPGMSGYQSTGTFISGSSFPRSNTGPIFMVFLVTTADPAVTSSTLQNVMNSNGWTVTTTSGSGLISGTMGNQTCNVTIATAYGTTQSRIYINYQTNNTPTATTGTTTGGGGCAAAQTGVMSSQSANPYGMVPNQNGTIPTVPGLVPNQ